MIRRAVAVGQFYKGDKNSLEKSIKNCFLDKRGPGSQPEIQNKKPIVKGIVVPHAGFIYSGAIAAHSYQFLSEHGFGDVFIILGPNHTGMGSGVSVMSEGSWETPLGNIPINEKIGKKLTSGIIDNDNIAHIQEHSIEVQLPFLKYCSKNNPFSFVPISMGMQDNETSKEIGTLIADVIKNSDENIVIIASSDFSHIGFNYMTMPPQNMRVDEYSKMQDMIAIDKIKKHEPEELIDIVHSKNISMCGAGPIAAMLWATKILECKHVELLKYGSSYEVHPSSSCVGYGALAVY